EENPKKRPLELDWDEVIPSEDDDEPPQSIVILKTEPEPPPPPPPAAAAKSSEIIDADHARREDLLRLTDRDLEEKIQRVKTTKLQFGRKLHDNGAKLDESIKRFEEERERRKLRLCDCKVVSAFHKELSTLNHGDRQKMRFNRESSLKGRQKGRSSSRKWPFVSSSSRSSNGGKNVFSYSDKKGRTSSIYPFYDTSTSMPSCNADNLKDAKIYYPSRDDPESVEISYKDIDCLTPEAFLKSPVMNFYIRYIQQATPKNRQDWDYHFFSTYFYRKLKQAVSYKGCDKDTHFAKFRRWWKGVNIFQKAYVFIPIHDDLHWSLVIICIPDKEEESGPIILHLDSLGLHCSKSIFSNIRNYMREEWNYLNQEVAPSCLPIADQVWKQLPGKIIDKRITVPQQKNEYDCGLFVLYFMERFIDEAPERLKKKDLAMFGKQWFKPEEASNLREKIRSILIEEFQIACISESNSPSSSSVAPA
ncbi:LOW QUALITY PROTEIN: Peptidase_C48 domain-containing protein, partial [Cephalotus follicularis]